MNTQKYIEGQIGNYYFEQRISPYSRREIAAINKQFRKMKKKAIKVEIRSVDNAETVALKAAQAIEAFNFAGLIKNG